MTTDVVNPYQAPQSSVATLSNEGFGEVKIFSLSGRLGRIRYLAYYFGILFLGYLIIGGLMAALHDAGEAMIIGISVLAGSVMVVVSVCLTVQRFHDFNASGWWTLLSVVPIVNIFLIALWFIPGTLGPNRFGKEPPPNGLGVKIIAFVFPAIMVIGIVAAIAIPAYQQYLAGNQ